MQSLDLLTIIGLISTFISLLLAFFIFSVESTNIISNRLFAFFLLLNAFEFSGWFSHLIFSEPNNLLIAKEQLSHLTIPVFYLYILSVCYSDFKLKNIHLWHALPYVVSNIVMLPRLYLASTQEKIALYSNFNDLTETYYNHISLHLQSIFYLTLCFIVLARAKKIFVENYSNSVRVQTYKWLFQLVLFMALLYGLAIIKNLLKFYGEVDNFRIAQISLSIIILSFVCWYVLKALKYPQLFKGVNSKTKLVTSIPIDNSQPINEKEVEMLKQYMTTQKPYLKASLSITSLAKSLKMNSRDLSVLINQNLNQHFFDFVNSYRIEEAKNILKDATKKDLTILEILYEVGFNSKSSFNTAFKKQTGFTPTQYRKTA